jgi:hypothetical protein
MTKNYFFRSLFSLCGFEFFEIAKSHSGERAQSKMHGQKSTQAVPLGWPSIEDFYDPKDS